MLKEDSCGPAVRSEQTVCPTENARACSGTAKRRATPLRTSREMYIAAIAALGIAAHLVLRYLIHAPRSVQLAPLFLALVGAVPVLVTLGRKLWAREFGSDLLAGISIIASVLMGQYLVAAIVV